MLATSPQMGNLEWLLRDVLERMDIEYMPPPRTSAKTVSIGSKYSPEFSCLPLKMNIGNFVEALEAGADTILMAGGKGPCRFGYYAEIQKRILKDAGYEFEMITIEPPSLGIRKFVGPIKKTTGKSTRQIWKILKHSFPKARAFDTVEKKVLETRCYELKAGDTTKAHQKAKQVLAPAKTPAEVVEAEREAHRLIADVPCDLNRPVLKIGIVGEFFILLEPFANFDIEEWLGNRGVYVTRGTYVTDWIGPSSKNLVAGTSDGELSRLAEPYLGHFVGGEGTQSVGHAVHYANEGYDGVVHMFPFTCMPDTIAKAILPRVGRDLDIPIIHFTIDEQTGRAGVITRLEAFLDLLAGRYGRRLEAAAGERKTV